MFWYNRQLANVLKISFSLLLPVTLFNAGQPTKPFLLMNHYTRKANFKFLMRNCCIHIIKHELLLWIFFWNWYPTFFFSLNAHSLIQSCYVLKLMFEVVPLALKLMIFFFLCGVYKLFCFLYTCSKAKKTHCHFDLMGVKSSVWIPAFAVEVP